LTPKQIQLANEKYLNRLARKVEREVAGVYRTAYSNIRTQLIDLFEKYSQGGKLTYADLSKYGRLAKLETEISKIMGRANQAGRAKTEAGMRLTFEETIARQEWAIKQQLGREISFGRIPQDAVRSAIENPLEKIAFDRLKAGGRNAIRSTIAQGLVQGVDYPTMARGIRSAINGTAQDALRIVRTETHRVQTEAHLLTTEKLQERGFTVRKVWVSVSDDRTREDHANADGQVADANGNFQVGVSIGPGPGLMQGPDSAAQNINCRCVYYEEIVDET